MDKDPRMAIGNKKTIIVIIDYCIEFVQYSYMRRYARLVALYEWDLHQHDHNENMSTPKSLISARWAEFDPQCNDL